MFKDYIELYKNINSKNNEWIVIYQKNEKQDLENDIFTFCALIDEDKINETDYMKKYDWDFSTNSFGKGGFGTYYYGDSSECLFNDGTTYDDFEYLVALRFFEKYYDVVEINPKLVWYKNLVKNNNDYYDPITNELLIDVDKCCIKIKRNYLKDFLSAIKKVCVIVFDHRRYFKSKERVDEKNESISNKDYYMMFSINNSSYFTNEYDGVALLIGKSIVYPFKQPHHSEYIYFNQEKSYETFIIDYDEDEEENIEFTCNEKELANYFGANSNAPHFLTPVFFDVKVLDKYSKDPSNYSISDNNISYLGEWTIPYNINNANRVSVWLGDLGRIPYDEQRYWRVFNIAPEGGMDSKFIANQILGIWTDSSRIESKLISSLNTINQIMKDKYNDIIFKDLSDTDKEINNSFLIPTNYSITEYQNFLVKLCKITSERINTKLIKTVMGDAYTDDVKDKGSILQLKEFFIHIGFDESGRIAQSLKKAHDSRCKLAAHTASSSKYNKVWEREENYKFNSVEDAKILLEEIVSSINYVTEVYKVKKNEA